MNIGEVVVVVVVVVGGKIEVSSGRVLGRMEGVLYDTLGSLKKSSVFRLLRYFIK
jgi:hypothetical protein